MPLYKQIGNLLILFGIALLATAIISYIGGNKITINNYYGTGGTTTEGGEIETGVKIDLHNIVELTGDSITIDEKILTDADLYNQYKAKNNYRSYFPEGQNRIVGNYGTNTEYMTKYLSDHTFNFSLPELVLTGYLYVRIKKPTNNDVFAYWYKSEEKNKYTISGDLDKSKTLILGSQTEFLYKLNEIPYKRYFDKKNDTYNWQHQLSRKNNYIAMFVKDFDGTNQIEEITIAWE